MKVNNSKEIDINSIYNENKLNNIKSQNGSNEPEAVKDKIEISSESKGIGKYVDLIKGMPDVRTDKVEEIKKMIDSGNYKISSHELASKILDAIKEGKDRK